MKMNRIQKLLSEIFQSLFSFVKIVLLSHFAVQIRKKDVAADEAVILANGPGLKNDLLQSGSLIRKRLKFCVNFFALSNEYQSLKPEYYILAAPEFWLEKTSEYFRTQKESLITALLTKTDWKMNLFIPFQAVDSEFHSAVKKNPNIKFIFYNNTPVEGLKSVSHLLFRVNLGMPRPHNVLIPSIFLALNLGFKKITLFGADHSWHEEIKVDPLNKVTVNHEHFYDGEKIRMPMYKLEGEEYYIHDIFRKLHFAFKGYFVLKTYAESIGASILNGSNKSYIDAFERIISTDVPKKITD